jgi:hypothetical protein
MQERWPCTKSTGYKGLVRRFVPTLPEAPLCVTTYLPTPPSPHSLNPPPLHPLPPFCAQPTNDCSDLYNAAVWISAVVAAGVAFLSAFAIIPLLKRKIIRSREQ